MTADGLHCAICRAADERLFVDHCHKTNRFRGLLCHTCNTGIGQLGDDPELLRAAANYLERVSDLL